MPSPPSLFLHHAAQVFFGAEAQRLCFARGAFARTATATLLSLRESQSVSAHLCLLGFARSACALGSYLDTTTLTCQQCASGRFGNSLFHTASSQFFLPNIFCFFCNVDFLFTCSGLLLSCHMRCMPPAHWLLTYWAFRAQVALGLALLEGWKTKR